MTSKTLLTLALAGMLSFGAGCKKEETSTTTDVPPPPPPADTAAAAPTTGDEVVTNYPGMVPQSGTKKTLQAFNVHQAADPQSKVLTRLGPGTLIDLKASFSNWMLIDWPCGVAKLCPGWIELRINDNRVSEATKPDAGTQQPPPDAGTTAPDAGTTAPDAGTTAPDAGRGRIKLNIPIPKRKE